MADQTSPQAAPPPSREEMEGWLRGALDTDQQLKENLTLATTPTADEAAQMSMPDPRTSQLSLWDRLTARMRTPEYKAEEARLQGMKAPSTLESLKMVGQSLVRGATKGATQAVRTVTDGVLDVVGNTQDYLPSTEVPVVSDAVRSMLPPEGQEQVPGKERNRISAAAIWRDPQEQRDLISWLDTPASKRPDPAFVGVPIAMKDEDLASWLGPSRGGALGFVEGIGQFAVGMAGAGRFGPIARAAEAAGPVAGGAIKGLVADTSFFDPYEERISNMIQSGPEFIRNPITDYLSAKPDDTASEARLKAGLEGIFTGAVFDVTLHALKVMRAKAWEKAGLGSAAETEQALREVVEASQVMDVPADDAVVQVVQGADGRYVVKLREDALLPYKVDFSEGDYSHLPTSGNVDLGKPEHRMWTVGDKDMTARILPEAKPPSPESLAKEQGIKASLENPGPDWQAAPVLAERPAPKPGSGLARVGESEDAIRRRLALEQNIPETRAALEKYPDNKRLKNRLKSQEAELAELNAATPSGKDEVVNVGQHAASQEPAVAPAAAEEAPAVPPETPAPIAAQEAPQATAEGPSFATRAEAESVAASVETAHANMLRPNGMLTEEGSAAWTEEGFRLFHDGMNAQGAQETLASMQGHHNYTQGPEDALKTVQAMTASAPSPKVVPRNTPKTRKELLDRAGGIFRTLNPDNVLALAESLYKRTEDVDDFITSLRAYTTMQVNDVWRLSVAADAAPHNAIAQDQLRQALESFNELHALVSGTGGNQARGLESWKMPGGDALNEMMKGMEPDVQAPKGNAPAPVARSGDVVKDSVVAESVPPQHQDWLEKKYEETAQTFKDGEKKAGPLKNKKLYETLDQKDARLAAEKGEKEAAKKLDPDYEMAWKDILEAERKAEREARAAMKKAKTAAEREAKRAEMWEAKERATLARRELEAKETWWERQWKRIGSGPENPKNKQGPLLPPEQGPDLPNRPVGPAYDPTFKGAEDAAERMRKYELGEDHKAAKAENRERDRLADPKWGKSRIQAAYEKMGTGVENPRLREGPSLPPMQGPKELKKPLFGPIYDPSHKGLADSQERLRKAEINYDHGEALKEDKRLTREKVNAIALKKQNADILTPEEKKLWAEERPGRAPGNRSITKGMTRAEVRALARSVMLAGKDPDAVLAALRGANFEKKAAEVIEPDMRVKMRNAAISFRMEAMLSGPKTQVANLLNNMFITLQRPAEFWWAGVGTPWRKGNKELRQFGIDMMKATWMPDLSHEGGDAMTAIFQNYGEAWKSFRKSWSMGQNFIDPAHMVTDGTGGLGTIATDKTGIGAVGHWLSIIGHAPSRALMAGDEFFKALNYRANVRAQILRQARESGVTDLGARLASDMDFAFSKGAAVNPVGLEYARVSTLTNDLEYGWGKAAQEFANKHPMFRLVVPFVRTPVNAFRYVWERTPGLNLANERWMQDYRAGEDGTKAGLERRNIAMAKMEMGGAIWASATMLALAGNLTGRGPSDPVLAKQWRDAGHQPYSFKVGDRYVSFKKADPIGTVLGMVADLVTVSKELNKGQRESAFSAVISGITANLTDKTFVSGISEFMEAMHSNREDVMNRYGQNLVTSFVPNLFKQVDPDNVIRETRNVVDEVMAKIPGFSAELEPRRNIFGEPIVQAPGLAEEHGAVGAVVDWAHNTLNPFTISGKVDDMDIAMQLVAMGRAMPMPNTKVTDSLIDLTDRTMFEEGREGGKPGQSPYDRMLEIIGQGPGDAMPLKQQLKEIMDTDEWKALPKDDLQNPGGMAHQMIATVMVTYQQAAFQQVLNEYPKLMEAYIQAQEGSAYGKAFGKDEALKMLKSGNNKLLIKPRGGTGE